MTTFFLKNRIFFFVVNEYLYAKGFGWVMDGGVFLSSRIAASVGISIIRLKNDHTISSAKIISGTLYPADKSYTYEDTYTIFTARACLKFFFGPQLKSKDDDPRDRFQ